MIVHRQIRGHSFPFALRDEELNAPQVHQLPLLHPKRPVIRVSKGLPAATTNAPSTF